MNEVWYIDTPLKTIKERLFYRHIAGGSDKKEAERKVASVDLSNAELVKKTLLFADKIVNLNN